jgi:pyridoxal phosphate enzyme (YggS family)
LSEIGERLARVQARIAAAARRAGRDPASITLVAVSKTVPPERIKEAVAAGVAVLAENRVQEAREKIEALGRLAQWHLVGHLQTNKAKLAVQLFDAIHSLDSMKLARELDRHAGVLGKRAPCLVEVNQGGELTKSGLTEEGVLPFLREAAGLANIEILGLMSVPPFLEDPEGLRPYFRRLRALRDAAAAAGIAGLRLEHLSMGMSHDFEVAIEEGATMVRIGTAIFGPRPS